MKNPVKINKAHAKNLDFSSTDKNNIVKGKIVKNDKTTTPFALIYFSILGLTIVAIPPDPVTFPSSPIVNEYVVSSSPTLYVYVPGSNPENVTVPFVRTVPVVDVPDELYIVTFLPV